MQCPECHRVMVQHGEFWFCGNHHPPVSLPGRMPVPQQTHLVDPLPTPLALLLSEYLRETSPFIALHRLTDLAELITRFFAIVTLCDLYHQTGDFPSTLKGELAGKLARPTFGAWRDIAASSLRILKEQKRPCFLSELPDFWQRRWQPLIGKTEGDPEKELLSLRNNLAHSGRMPDERVAALLEQHGPIFNSVIKELAFLARYPLVATGKEGETPFILRGLPAPEDWSLPLANFGAFPMTLRPQRVYLVNENNTLDLFPLHSYDVVSRGREEERSFRETDERAPLIYLRYNENRGVLEFTALAPHIPFAQRGKEFREPFLAMFNLSEWRKELEDAAIRRSEWHRWSYDFRSLIVELTDGLVGRTQQLEEAKGWISEHQEAGGVLWLTGNPGVGKSAFMAALAQKLMGNAKLCVVPYFFRSGDARCSPDHFYQAATLRITETFGTQAQFDPQDPRHVQFLKTLEAVSQKQKTDKPTLVFLLDGLDEVIGQQLDFARLILSQRYPQMIWLCAGRRVQPLVDVFGVEGVESLWDEGELPPLARSDVRELVERECDRLRYQLFVRDELNSDGQYDNRFVETLAARSEGLPLYIRLVIDDLLAGRMTFRGEDSLPDGLREYFDRILSRHDVGDIPMMLTDVMALLCHAREPLGEVVIREILQPLYSPYVADWESTLAEALHYGHVMIRRAKTPDGVWGWTLYHDSFRRHLLNTPTIRTARERAIRLLLAWCTHWQTHRNTYALRHYPDHLYAIQNSVELYNIANNNKFLDMQFLELNEDPDAPLQTLRLALQNARDQEEVRGMAAFSIAHANRLKETIKASPLEALRSDKLTRALRLTSLYSLHKRILWELLLAWELKDTGEIHRAQELLAKLVIDVQALGATDSWAAPRVLLEAVQDLPVMGLSEMLKAMYSEDIPTQRRDLEMEIPFMWSWSKHIHSIENAVGQHYEMVEEEMFGDYEPPEEERKHLIDQISSEERDLDLIHKIKNLSNNRQFNAACKMASKLSSDERDFALWCIVQDMLNAGYFHYAESVMRRIKDTQRKVRVCCTIAFAFAHAGDSQNANKIIETAIEVASEGVIGLPSMLGLHDLAYIACTQIRLEVDYKRVLDLAYDRAIASDSWRGQRLLWEVATIHALSGNNDRARTIIAESFLSKRDDWIEKATALREISEIQFAIGEYVAAGKTTENALEYAGRSAYNRLKPIVFRDIRLVQKKIANITPRTSMLEKPIGGVLSAYFTPAFQEKIGLILLPLVLVGGVVDLRYLTQRGLLQAWTSVLFLIWRIFFIIIILKLHFLMRTQRRAISKDERRRGEPDRTRALKFAQSMDYKEALNTADRIDIPRARDETLKDIIVTMIQQNRPLNAIEAIDNIRSDDWKVKAIIALGEFPDIAEYKDQVQAWFNTIQDRERWSLQPKQMAAMAFVQHRMGNDIEARANYTAAIRRRTIRLEPWMLTIPTILLLRSKFPDLASEALWKLFMASADGLSSDTRIEVLEACREHPDKDQLNLLLPICLYDSAVTYRLSSLLATVYPQHATAIAEVLMTD